MTHFKIIIPSYNSVRWLRRTLKSVASQTFKNYEVCVIDDASTQEGQKDIIEEFEKKYGWTAIYRMKNFGSVANIVDGISSLNPANEDIILLLDGDDWLYDKYVLEKLDRIYTAEPVSLTYGQFITYPDWDIGFCRPPKPEEVATREGPWIYSHPKTFRYSLWKLLNLNDLKDKDGHYYRTAGDFAIMYPLVEMAGYTIKCVDEILYVYNLTNPLSDFTKDLKKQEAVCEEIRKKTHYPTMMTGSCVNLPASKWTRFKWKLISWKNKLLAPLFYR